jgi:hypothetical protein
MDLVRNAVGYNEPVRDWFPWAVHQVNQMRWALLDREAREQLVNWEWDWSAALPGADSLCAGPTL